MTDKQPQPQGDAAMPVVAWLGETLGVRFTSIDRQKVDNWIGSDGDCAEPINPQPLIRQSDAQAAIAARDAEIERLRNQVAQWTAMTGAALGGPAGQQLYEAAIRNPAPDAAVPAVGSPSVTVQFGGAPEAAQPADTEAQVHEVMRLVRGLLGPDAWHGPWASVTSDALAAVESAIRRLV
jgi:hypothetical protein